MSQRKLYNIIWADDDASVFSPEQIEYLELEDINLLAHAATGFEFTNLVDKYKGKFDAVVLDVNFAYGNNGEVDKNETNGFSTALTCLSSCSDIPVFVYTGKTELLDIPDYQQGQLKRLEWPPMHKGDRDKLIERIKKAVDSRGTVEYQIRKNYSIELEAARFLGEQYEGYIFDFLVAHIKHDLSGTERFYNCLRSIMQRVFEDGIKRKVFPPLRQNEKSVYNLNGFGKLLEHSPNVDSYKLLRPESFVPFAQGYAFSFLLKYSQEGSHPNTEHMVAEYVAKNENINLFVSLLFIELDLLRWYHDLVKKYEDPNNQEFKDGKIWTSSILEHLVVEEIRNEEKIYFIAKNGSDSYYLEQKRVSPQLSNGDIVTIKSWVENKNPSIDAKYYCSSNKYEIEPK